MNAVELFEHNDIPAFAGFVAQLGSGAGAARWKELHSLITNRFTSVRSDYLKAVERAKAERAELEKRHASNVQRRDEMREHLATLDNAIESFPKQIADADAAPARIAEQFNGEMSPEDVEKISAALKLYVESFK